MKKLIAALFLIIALKVGAQNSVFFYVSSTNPAAGSGTLLDPWSKLSSVNLTTLATYAGNGTNPYVLIQNGSVQREQWSIGASGTTATNIIVSNYPGPYGAGLPRIVGSTNLTGWVAFAPANGSTWSNNVSRADYVFNNGVLLNLGSGAATLYNHEYFFSGTTIYVRWDEGSPDALSNLLEVTIRTGVFNTASARSNYTFVNLDLGQCFGPIARTTGTNFTYRNCIVHQGPTGVYFSNCGGSIYNSVISECYTGQGVQCDGVNGHFNIFYSLFASNIVGVFTSAGTGGQLINCTFIASQNNAINDTGAAVPVGITNCIFASNGYIGAGGTYAVVATTTNNVTMDSCQVLLNAKATNPYRTRNVTEYNTIQGFAHFKALPHVGYYGFEIDDIPNVAQASRISYMLDALGLGWPMCHAASTKQGQGLDANTITLLQSMFARGHNINCHSSYHSWIPNIYGFSVQYSGPAPTCTMSITGSNTITFFTNLVQDFTVSYDTNTLGSTTIATINSHAGYTLFSLVQVRDPNVPPVFWTNATLQDIKTSSFTNQWIQQSKLNREVIQSRIDLTNAVPGLTISNFVYPNGAWDNILVTNLINAGYLGGRSAGIPPAVGYQVGYTNNVWFLATLQNTTGYQYQLAFENDGCIDSSPNGNNYTNSGIIFENTNIYETLWSGMFNGSNAFCWNANKATNFDFSKGDWDVACAIWPYASGASTSRVLYYNGTNSGNFIQCSLEANNALRMTAQNNGTVLFDLQTTNNAVTSSTWQTVSFQQELGICKIFVSNIVVAVTTTNVANPLNYGGTNYWGRAINWTGPVGTNYYFGLMDNAEGFKEGVYYTHSLLDLMGTEGMMGLLFAHASASQPEEAWRIARDAFYDYTAINQGSAYFVSQITMNNITLTNGVLMTDGQTIMRTNSYPSTANFQLKATSPLRYTGNASVYVGQTNLVDLLGQRITDSNGALVRSTVSIGAYEFSPKKSNGFLN